MSVNTSNNVSPSATKAYYQSLPSFKGKGGNSASEATAAAVNDQYTASGAGSAASGVYSNMPASAQKFFEMAEARFASMRGAVESLIGGMGGSNGQAFWAAAAGGGSQLSFDNFRVDAATQAKAQELTGEDGYFGVRRTTERIMEFARALAGEGADEKTIENLRSGVQKGFDSVARLFGGFDKLPELTRNTYDSIMGEFDKWVGAGQTAA